MADCLLSEELVLNIPHASTFIPDDEYDRYFIPTSKETDRYPSLAYKKRINLEIELLMMSDWYTDELFDHGVGRAVIAQVSRLVCDTERFAEDGNEMMAKKGMGACYTHGYDEKCIRKYDTGHRNELMEKYYYPYHRALEEVVTDSLERHGSCLILDCHSFHEEALPYEPDQENDRCDICIGTDSYHTPKDLVSFAKDFFRSRGYSVKIDSPYEGAMVPMRYYHREPRLSSMMIEINRGLYLERFSRAKKREFYSLSNDIELFEKLILQWL